MSSINPNFWDPTQYNSALIDDLFYQSVLPAVASAKLYTEFGEPATTLSQPYFMETPTPISEMLLGQAKLPINIIQPPVSDVSFSMTNESPLRENSTSKIEQDASNEDSCTNIKQYPKTKPGRTRRVKSRKTPRTVQQELSLLENNDRLLEEATSEEEKQSLKRQRRTIKNRIAAYVPH